MVTHPRRGMPSATLATTRATSAQEQVCSGARNADGTCHRAAEANNAPIYSWNRAARTRLHGTGPCSTARFWLAFTWK